MSREEAAIVYIDGLLGFRGEYQKFQQAADTLTDQEKELLVDATMDTVKECSTDEKVGSAFFHALQ